MNAVLHRSRHLRLLPARALVFAPAALFLLLWTACVDGSPRAQFLFASPELVFLRAVEEYQTITIWRDIGLTAVEALSGLFAGSAAGTLVALLLWSRPCFQRIARPYIALAGSIPVFALAPMLIIWFGTGITAKIVMAGFGVFIVTVVQLFEGIGTVAQDHIRFARMCGARDTAIMRKILLPGAARWLFAAMRLNVGVAFLGAFIGEFITSQAGLGHFIIEAGQLYDMPGVIFGLLNLSLLALLCDKVLQAITPDYL